MTRETPIYVPYHEPCVPVILILSTFLLALNIVDFIVDRTTSCGLAGQVLLGIAWVDPGTRWLNWVAEKLIVQLSYVRLFLVVYEDILSLRKESHIRSDDHDARETVYLLCLCESQSLNLHWRCAYWYRYAHCPFLRAMQSC